MSIKDYFPTEEQRLRARAFTIEAAAWIAVVAVLAYRFLALTYGFFCDKVLPLARISAIHAVLAWQDYQVGRDEFDLFRPSVTAKSSPTRPRGFKS